jgi:membrane associated rhomboid family serine protease
VGSDIPVGGPLPDIAEDRPAKTQKTPPTRKTDIAATDESSGGVAYMAHIGGFASGVAMTYLFRGRSESDTLA